MQPQERCQEWRKNGWCFPKHTSRWWENQILIGSLHLYAIHMKWKCELGKTLLSVVVYKIWHITFAFRCDQFSVRLWIKKAFFTSFKAYNHIMNCYHPSIMSEISIMLIEHFTYLRSYWANCNGNVVCTILWPYHSSIDTGRHFYHLGF